MKGSIKEGYMPRQRRQHTPEFKREAVRLVCESGNGLNQTARDLGIHRSILSRWVHNASTEGSDAFRGHGNRTALEQENATLHRRIRVLEEERDILKKAATWFAKESQ